jgi:hypothetical protein
MALQGMGMDGGEVLFGVKILATLDRSRARTLAEALKQLHTKTQAAFKAY